MNTRGRKKFLDFIVVKWDGVVYVSKYKEKIALPEEKKKKLQHGQFILDNALVV